MPNMLIIINPFANRGDSKHQIDLALQKLSESGLDYEIKLTEYRGHAIELAQQAYRDGIPVVVAAGGDGTVNEVANGLLTAAERDEGVIGSALGVLPIGSGNDFSWGMGVGPTLDAALAKLRRGQTRVIDVGYIEPDTAPPRYFVNIVGAGFDARVNIEAHKIKRLRGFAIYLAAVLKTLSIYHRTPRTKLHFNGSVLEIPLFMGLVANGRRLGGGFLAAPEAEPDDGLFDLCLVTDIGRFEALPVIPKLMKGEHTTHPKVIMARAPEVIIECPEGFPSEADGEMVGEEIYRMKVSLIPKRLKVIA